ncbi:unnamed protein product [Tilletia caries]|nr:unnamed protein product [Tilletia caries]
MGTAGIALQLRKMAPVRSQLPDGSGSATGGRASKTKRPRRAPPRNLALSSVQNPTSPPPHQPNSFCMDEDWSFGGDDNNGWENFDSASAREENAPELFNSTFPLERSTQPAPERVVDEVEDYLGMLFRENAAIVVRIDSRMWVMEGVKDGVPDFGMFYHVTLYEGYIKRCEVF